MSGVGSSPALATCETIQVLLAGVSGGFPGVLSFRPTYRLVRLDMGEIILKGTLNRIKKYFPVFHYFVNNKIMYGPNQVAYNTGLSTLMIV